MQTNTEIQYLQNAANYFGGTINEKFEQDKRKKIKKYFLTIYGVTESPVLDYENMVHFLLGIIRGLESSKKYNLKTKNEIFK